jgi:hypothetical protein
MKLLDRIEEYNKGFIADNELIDYVNKFNHIAYLTGEEVGKLSKLLEEFKNNK